MSNLGRYRLNVGQYVTIDKWMRERMIKGLTPLTTKDKGVLETFERT